MVRLKNWTINRNYGIDQLTALAEHFSVPLFAAKSDKEKCFQEWKLFRSLVNANYRGLDAKQLWEKVFQYKRAEYPNLCIVANLVMCLSGSNSTVERAFSLLTLLLTDQRLSLSHNTISNLMTINVNDKWWTPNEKSSIIKSAAEAYENAKRRIRVCDWMIGQ